MVRVLSELGNEVGWDVTWQWLQKEMNLWKKGSVKVVFLGVADSGKRTLMRQLFGGNHRMSRIFSVIDLPGIDEYVGYGRDAGSLRAAAHADLIVLVLDARLQPTRSTISLVDSIDELGIPTLVVLNKLDQVVDPRGVVSDSRKLLARDVIGISLKSPVGIRRLLREILALQPQLLFSLAREYPEYRDTLAEEILEENSIASAILSSKGKDRNARALSLLMKASLFLKLSHIYADGWEKDTIIAAAGALGGVTAIESVLHLLLSKTGIRRAVVPILATGVAVYLVGRLLNSRRETNHDALPEAAV
jgi:GTP-binding protein EngB required for normal cell division